MSLIKRSEITSSDAADSMAAADVKPHDPVRTGMPLKQWSREQRIKLSAARVQLKQHESSARRLLKRIQRLRTRSQYWQQQALMVAAQNEEKALACLQLRRQLSLQIAKLADYQERCVQCALQLAVYITGLESGTLQQKPGAIMSINVDTWDAVQTEMVTPSSAVASEDELEKIVVTDENRQTLMTELATLLAVHPAVAATSH